MPGRGHIKRCRDVAKALEDSGAFKDAEAILSVVRLVDKLYKERQRAVWQSRYARRQVADLIARVEMILSAPEGV